MLATCQGDDGRKARLELPLAKQKTNDVTKHSWWEEILLAAQKLLTCCFYLSYKNHHEK
jgi:hypothetical protein